MEIPANEERQCEETVMGEMLRGLGLIGLLVVTLILVGSSPGRTAESFSVYEDWTGGSIRADRWLGFETFGGQEVKREVSGRFLRMRLASADRGAPARIWVLPTRRSLPIS